MGRWDNVGDKSIRLEWHGPEAVLVGDRVDVELWAYGDPTRTDITIMQMLFEWDNDVLEFIGTPNRNLDPPWDQYASAFAPFRNVANNAPGINENAPAPPKNGQGLWSWNDAPGTNRAVPTDGTLLEVFQFSAIKPGVAKLSILDSLPNWPGIPGETKAAVGFWPLKLMLGEYAVKVAPEQGSQQASTSTEIQGILQDLDLRITAIEEKLA